MPKKISLDLKSSYFLFYLAMLSCVALFLMFSFLVSIFLPLFSMGMFEYALVIALTVLIIALLVMSLIAVWRQCAELHYSVSFDDGIWWINSAELSDLRLLHRSNFGLLLRFTELDSNNVRTVWLSSHRSGQKNIRRLSRCFKA